MAYEVVMSYHLHMPSYFLGTFTEYPYCYSEYYNPHTYLKRNIPKNSGQWKFGFSKSMGFHDRK